MVGNNRPLSNGNVGNSATTSNRRQLPNLNAAAAPRRKEPADPQTRAAYRELQQLRNSIMSQYNIKNATSVLSDTSLKQIVNIVFQSLVADSNSLTLSLFRLLNFLSMRENLLW